jgi:NodT family efflux transporter outer membrane factor (OMF) lipoprotein
MPKKWLADGIVTDPNDLNLAHWWQSFDDQALNTLVDELLDSSLDLSQAYLRIAQARRTLDFTAGQYWPSADINGNYTRSRDSENTYLATPGIPAEQYDFHSIGIDSSWEIDLFGRIKRSVESARASFQADVYDYYNTRVSLIAETAINYIQLRTVQRRISLAHQNIETQQETLQLTKDRFDAGLAPELDVFQARQNLANTRAQIPSLQLQQQKIKNRIAVLLGSFPSQLEINLQTHGRIPPVPEKLTVTLPAELLRRRADIRNAERLLAAQTAQIGAAEADLYPRFSISGSFAFQAEQLREVGLRTSRAYSFGPAVSWNIFDADRLKNKLEIEKIKRTSAYIQYDKTVLQAVEEVENALAAYNYNTRRSKQLDQSVKAAKRSVELVRSLYSSGLTDFQNVLDTQRTLFNQQDQLAASRGQVVIDIITLYKALGGGWYESMRVEKNRQNTPKQKNTGS